MTVLVLGGRGFIGRHAVAAPRERGVDVVVGSRAPARAGVVSARFERLTEADAWLPFLAGIDVVVNCVGILRARPGESYDAVHHRAPAALARAATGRIAALDVDDLGAAIAALCLGPVRHGLRACEVGGLERRTPAEHLQALRRGAGRGPAWTVRVPGIVSRFGARLCDALHWSPYSGGHLELLSRDNLPRDNALPALLGRAPTAVGRGPSPAFDTTSRPSGLPA